MLNDKIEIIIKQVNPTSQKALTLTMKLFNELELIYGKGKIEDFTSEKGEFIYFILVYHNFETIGCGALKHFGKETAEIKRMYVNKEFRGRGISKLILTNLEETAKEKKYKRIVLETGIRQPEAVHLYEKYGYKRMNCYGRYTNDPESICFQKYV
ncbi:MAG: GNAT family N-acetyltransferase [Ignavibacteria bacterium]|nr:GNAT family N-acetyltransferase [Ignavibacteria bacterium]